MKVIYIYMITFLCTIYIPERSTAEIENNFTTQPTDDASNIFKENGSKNYTSDMLRGMKNMMPPGPARSCLDLKKQNRRSGTYMINPCDDTPSKVVKVYCDMKTDGGGWTVIQRRDNYPQQQDFYNTWVEYMLGFGDVTKDFWLGNENIHCLTKQSSNEIRFDLKDMTNSARYAKYGFFYVHDEATKFKLVVQDYSGDAGDSFIPWHNGMHFSTFDADNDPHSGNCASEFTGAWWYNKCHKSNLNGLYNVTTFGKGINWYHWKGWTYSLKKTEMKIRPKY